MGESRCAEYIDFLSQIGVVESVRGEDGEQLLTVKIPLGQMLKKAIGDGAAPPESAGDLLSWASCALASEILGEREVLHSKQDLLCVAALLRAFISEAIETEPECTLCGLERSYNSHRGDRRERAQLCDRSSIARRSH